MGFFRKVCLIVHAIKFILLVAGLEYLEVRELSGVKAEVLHIHLVDFIVEVAQVLAFGNCQDDLVVLEIQLFSKIIFAVVQKASNMLARCKGATQMPPASFISIFLGEFSES